MLVIDWVKTLGRSCSSSAAVWPATRASLKIRRAWSRSRISASMTRAPRTIRMSVTALFSGNGKV